MKKTISINISGIIFHIEEDGYETLRKYLDSVNRYFSSFEDSSEILSDIESRIAEIFLAKLNEGKQVITAEDVTSLMTTMGNVNDFKAAEETEFAATADASQKNQEQKQSYSAGASPNKRLFRDQKRKMLGGVCAGLGHYFNVDAVWPRVILALLAFGYGGGILLYIILWIALPASDTLEEEPSVKKMYRNPDQKVLGGVASGIASFFGADIAIIRLLFVITAFFGGAGFILYVILWISLSEARTITEKMEMQGEPVTLSNIESTVKKGLNEKDQPEESTLAKIILFPFRALAAILNAIGKFLGPVFNVFVDVLRVAIGILITLIGLTFLLSIIFIGGVALGIFSVNTPLWGDAEFRALSLPMEAIRNGFPGWTIVFAFLASIIPALFMLLIGSSIIAKKVIFRPIVGWTLFVTFFVSIAFLSISIPQFIFLFKEEGDYKVENTFTVAGNTLQFDVKEVGLDDYDMTTLTLRGYDSKELKLIQRFESQGSTRKVAAENAQMVTYGVAQKNDSVLIFDSNITFKKDAKFRAQRLNMELFIPYHQKFKINKELWRLINNYNRNGYRYNGYRYSDYNQSEDNIWEMTEAGLKCTNCPEEEENENETPGNTTNGEAGLGSRDQFGLSGFNGIDMSGLFRVNIEKGNSYSVRMEGKESLKSRYKVSLDGETLVIDYNDKREFFWKNLSDDDEIRITITLPHLEDVRVRGGGTISITGFQEENMEIKLLGAIVGDADLKVNNLGIDITGASSLSLTGNGDFMEATVTGASGLRAYGYEVERAIVDAKGASNAKVNVTQTLETSSSIASTISHRGDPEVIKRD